MAVLGPKHYTVTVLDFSAVQVLVLELSGCLAHLKEVSVADYRADLCGCVWGFTQTFWESSQMHQQSEFRLSLTEKLLITLGPDINLRRKPGVSWPSWNICCVTDVLLSRCQVKWVHALDTDRDRTVGECSSHVIPLSSFDGVDVLQ